MSARKRALPRRIERNDSRLQICAQLIEEELLDGWLYVDAEGMPLRVMNTRLTEIGLDYLMQTQEETILRPQNWEKIPFGLRQSAKAVAAFLLLIIILCLVNGSSGNVMHADAKEVLAATGSDSVSPAKACPFRGLDPVE